MEKCIICVVNDSIAATCSFCLTCLQTQKIPEIVMQHLDRTRALLYALSLQRGGKTGVADWQRPDKRASETVLKPPLPEGFEEAVKNACEFALNTDVRRLVGMAGISFQIWICDGIEDTKTHRQIMTLGNPGGTNPRIKRILCHADNTELAMLFCKIFFSALDMLHFKVIDSSLGSEYNSSVETDRIRAAINFLDKAYSSDWSYLLYGIRNSPSPCISAELWKNEKFLVFLNSMHRVHPTLREWHKVKNDRKSYEASIKKAEQSVSGMPPERLYGAIRFDFTTTHDKLNWAFTCWFHGMPPLSDLAEGERPFILNCAQTTCLHELGHIFRYMKGEIRPARTDYEWSTKDTARQFDERWSEMAAAVIDEKGPHLLELDSAWNATEEISGARDARTVGFDRQTARLIQIYRMGHGRVWSNLEEFYNIFISDTSENAVRKILDLPLRFGHSVLPY